MKTKLTALLLSSFYCFSIFLHTGCSDEPNCPGEKEENLYIPDYDKAILPYKGYDTLSFLNSNGDTIKLIGKGIKVSFESDSKRDPSPDCNVYDKVNYEINDFDFSIIYIKQRYRNRLFNISLNQNEQYTVPYKTVGAKLVDPKVLVKFYDSIEINGLKYYDVSRFSGIDTSDKIYINRLHGILKIENKTQNIYWTIITK